MEYSDENLENLCQRMQSRSAYFGDGVPLDKAICDILVAARMLPDANRRIKQLKAQLTNHGYADLQYQLDSAVAENEKLQKQREVVTPSFFHTHSIDCKISDSDKRALRNIAAYMESQRAVASPYLGWTEDVVVLRRLISQ